MSNMQLEVIIYFGYAVDRAITSCRPSTIVVKVYKFDQSYHILHVYIEEVIRTYFSPTRYAISVLINVIKCIIFI